MVLRLPPHSAPKAVLLAGPSNTVLSLGPCSYLQACLPALSAQIHSGMVSIPAPRSLADSLPSTELNLSGLPPVEWLLRGFCMKQTYNQVRSLWHLPSKAWCGLPCSFSPTAGCRFVQLSPQLTSIITEATYLGGDLCNSMVFSSQEFFPGFIMGIVGLGSIVTW